MEVAIRSTTDFEEVLINGVAVKARIWWGRSQSGIILKFFVPLFAVYEDSQVKLTDAQKAEMEREFNQQPRPLNLT